ncbi:DUF2867 domain-containing protein [bacterium]|nr:DUF2867 domain-containing protein [bacterium]
MLVEYLLKHPGSYIHSGFPMERMVGYLRGVVSSDDAEAPWDVADASRILLDCTDDPGAREEAIRVLAGYQESRTFYANRENIHCIATESAQEIIDYLVQDLPMLPNQPIQYYINELTRGRDDHRITASLRRIEIDPSTYGRHRHNLRQILAMVWAYIKKHGDDEGHDRESMIERLVQELVDMCGTCSTGHAVRLLNVLSGYRDFAIRPRDLATAVCEAQVQEDSAFAGKRWVDLADVEDLPHRYGGKAEGTRLVDHRHAVVAVEPARAFAAIERIGGPNGWYACDWLWTFRGWLDRLIGGPGMSRGRRDPERLATGDTLDCWRVELCHPPHRLRLAAEMKMPGRGWLEFEVVPRDGDVTIHQTAVFDPKGLGGLAYWYAIWPLHELVFKNMLAGIVRHAVRKT